MSCHGRPRPDRDWRIGVSDPFERGRTLRTVVAAGPLGVATSGWAERGTHVVDPHSGGRPTALAAVTVVASDVIRADVLATAAIAMGPAGVDWLRELPDVNAVVVRADRSVVELFG